MKKRLTIYASISIGFICVLGLILIWFYPRSFQSRFSSSTSIRPHALAHYGKYFENDRKKFYDYPIIGEPSDPELDFSQTNALKVVWHETASSDLVGEYGVIKEADPETQKVELPNGQVLSLVAIARSPNPTRLIREQDPEYYGRSYQVEWLDPVTYEPIEDLESFGLPEKLDVGRHQQLMLAFQLTDQDEKPVRWQWAGIFDEVTKISVADSYSRQDFKQNTVYELKLNVHHDTPLRISLPLAFGSREIKKMDISNDGGSILFDQTKTQIQFLTTIDGYSNGSSWRSNGDKFEASFRYIEGNRNSKKGSSFSLFRIFPKFHMHALEYLALDSADKWRSVHPNHDLVRIRHDVNKVDATELEWRQYSEFACFTFKLPSIPGLKKVRNLFDVELGPIVITYDSEFSQIISKATGLHWQFYSASIPREKFPIEFPDPSTTPRDLLDYYEAQIGQELFVDQKKLIISKPQMSFLQKFLDMIDNIF